jgi:ferric-dicitrate binding protein FerR (iron transport regulator)
MYEVIRRSLRNRASEAELSELRSWREADGSNESRYQELARLIELTDDTLSEAATPPVPSGSDLVRRAELRRRPGRERSRGRSWHRAAIWGWGAGGATLAAAAIAWVLLTRSTAVDPALDPGAGEFTTGPGESATVVLADGTVVRLAPDSRLRVPTVTPTREVFLDGTAYFAVVKMPEHPFRVRSQAGDAVVLGTRFELQVRGEDLRLVVVDGRVALGSEGKPVVVQGGEMSRVSNGTTLDPVEVGDARAMLPWLDRFIVFQSTPLSEAARDLERAYGVRIEVRDSTLAAQTLTGWYADREFDDMLGIVCGVLEASCTFENGIATIERGT